MSNNSTSYNWRAANQKQPGIPTDLEQLETQIIDIGEMSEALLEIIKCKREIRGAAITITQTSMLMHLDEDFSDFEVISRMFSTQESEDIYQEILAVITRRFREKKEQLLRQYKEQYNKD